mgnify:CR=1 FL=1
MLKYVSVGAKNHKFRLRPELVGSKQQKYTTKDVIIILSVIISAAMMGVGLWGMMHTCNEKVQNITI